MKRMSAGEWGLLVTLGILWGGSFFFQKVAVGALPPFTVLLARVGLAAATLWIAARAAGYRLPPPGRLWVPFVVMAILNNVIPFSLILWGQTRIGSGLAAILNACAPLFTAVLAHFLTRDERLTPRRATGVLLGFAGVVLMIGPDSLGGLGRDVLAQLGVLAAGVSYACAGIFGRRSPRRPCSSCPSRCSWTVRGRSPRPPRASGPLSSGWPSSAPRSATWSTSAPRHRGRDESAARDASDAGDRARAGYADARRAPRAPSPGRHGADRRGACTD